MAFKYTENGFDYNGNVKITSIEQINKAERRLTNKKQVLEDLENEFNLIEMQTFNTYKDNIYYLLLDQKGYINACKDWLHMQEKKVDKNGNKLDGRKSYKEKDLFNWYIDKIKEYLGIEELSNVSFVDYNFGEGTYIRFSYLGHNWELYVPHISDIRIKSFQIYGGASVFKLRLTHQDKKYSCSWKFIGSTFDEEELKDIFAKGVEKYCS